MFKMTIPIGTPLYFAVVDLPPRVRNAEINKLAVIGFKAKVIIKNEVIFVEQQNSKKMCSFKISISDPELNQHLLKYPAKARNIEFYRFATQGLYACDDETNLHLSQQIKEETLTDVSAKFVDFGSELFEL